MSAAECWVQAMRRGDFHAAWRASDRILAARDPATRDDPGLPYHLRWVWDGTPLDGRRVLVRCYHGLGDTVQFCRFLPVLARRAGSVRVEAQPELLPLMRQIPGVDAWIAFDPAHPAPPAEVDVELMELCYALRCLPRDATPAPYLTAARATEWHESGGGASVGVCWEAGGWDPARSVPLPLLARALAGVAPLVLLQRGPGAEQALADDAPRFVNPLDRSLDLVRTAELLAACARVVTVDTMVAHLAGAMGRPTALLLRRDADWRWLADGDSSPWYPTLRLFRQRIDGDWSVPLAGLRRWLTRASLSREAAWA